MTKPVVPGRSAGGDSRRSTRTLVVFAKLPRAGQVKTRLIPMLGKAGAASLYGAFLDDTVHVARQIGEVARELWVVRHSDGLGSLEERYTDFSVRGQPSGDLGDRMRGAFDSAFAEGAEHVLIIGSDHPTLPASYVEQGFEALKGAHLVLGPTSDGGYYGVGLRRRAWPRAAGLFDGIAWSTPGVLAQTRRRVEELELCHVELPSWYDVDEPDQLVRLAEDVDSGSATGRMLEALGVLGRLQGATVPRAPRPAGRGECGSGSRVVQGEAS
jgi:rSAM/selenodomain-associated transferase 1